ncbi:MAG TPA: DUF4167 domain-containing protein [Hyphomicrobiales bacterium]|nr:DUF4167 domain-containing protein [Hyphomicrobiales bacterium]
MRQGQSKRSRGRSRSKSSNPLSRTYESNGPDVKIRGTAAHIADKYVQLARDAQSSGDPVAAESYFQHAEHYYRLLAAAQPPFQTYPGFTRADQDDLDGEEEDFEGGGEDGPMPVDAAQPAAPYLQDQPPREDGRGERRFEGRNGERRFEDRGERRDNRDDQRRFDNNRDYQPREPRRERPEDRERDPGERGDNGGGRYPRRERYEPAGEAEGHDALPAFITGGGAPAEERGENAERAENGTRYAGRGRRRRYGNRFGRDGEQAPAGDNGAAHAEGGQGGGSADFAPPEPAAGE